MAIPIALVGLSPAVKALLGITGIAGVAAGTKLASTGTKVSAPPTPWEFAGGGPAGLLAGGLLVNSPVANQLLARQASSGVRMFQDQIDIPEDADDTPTEDTEETKKKKEKTPYAPPKILKPGWVTAIPGVGELQMLGLGGHWAGHVLTGGKGPNWPNVGKSAAIAGRIYVTGRAAQHYLFGGHKRDSENQDIRRRALSEFVEEKALEGRYDLSPEGIKDLARRVEEGSVLINEGTWLRALNSTPNSSAIQDYYDRRPYERPVAQRLFAVSGLESIDPDTESRSKLGAILLGNKRLSERDVSGTFYDPVSLIENVTRATSIAEQVIARGSQGDPRIAYASLVEARDGLKEHLQYFGDAMRTNDLSRYERMVNQIDEMNSDINKLEVAARSRGIQL